MFSALREKAVEGWSPVALDRNINPALTGINNPSVQGVSRSVDLNANCRTRLELDGHQRCLMRAISNTMTSDDDEDATLYLVFAHC